MEYKICLFLRIEVVDEVHRVSNNFSSRINDSNHF